MGTAVFALVCFCDMVLCPEEQIFRHGLEIHAATLLQADEGFCDPAILSFQKGEQLLLPTDIISRLLIFSVACR